jgi:RNA polymerase sigma factor (sigma-70 family)
MPRRRTRPLEHPVFSDCNQAALVQETQSYFALRALGQTPPAQLTRAWEQFYGIYDRLVRGCLRSWRLPEPDLSDCIQEVWLKIIAHLIRFQPADERTQIGPWISTLARNTVLDLIRERARHPQVSASREILTHLTGREVDPADEMERHCVQTLVQEALDELAHRVSAISYRVLYLRAFEQRTVAETASELGLTPEQIRLQHHRAMVKLRRLIEIRDGMSGCGEPATPPVTSIHANIHRSVRA